MNYKKLLPLFTFLAISYANAEDFGYLQEWDYLHCYIDGTRPKRNAKEDGCSFFRHDTPDGTVMGYTTVNGKIIIPPIYRTLMDRSYYPKFLVATKPNGKWGMLDKHNNIIIPFEYDIVEDTESENFFVVGLGDFKNDPKNVKLGMYNTKGNMIVPIGKYDGIGRVIKGKKQTYIEIRVKEKYGFLNDKGELIIQPKYSLEEIFKIEKGLERKEI